MPSVWDVGLTSKTSLFWGFSRKSKRFTKHLKLEWTSLPNSAYAVGQLLKSQLHPLPLQVSLQKDRLLGGMTHNILYRSQPRTEGVFVHRFGGFLLLGSALPRFQATLAGLKPNFYLFSTVRWPAKQEMRVQSLNWQDPWRRKEMATHSSILAWEIPRTEEPVLYRWAIVHGLTKVSGTT